MKTLLVAGAFACLCVPAFSAECLTIAGFADFIDGNEKGAEIIEVVPVNSQAIDNLVIFRAENGNVLMMPEFDGCMFGSPVLIDLQGDEVGA
ncbi:hypothetical protein [Devosia sp. SL43]|uniref:hypothetical protein n=1 Tax=Devosia sp. SL43 TaxID=2806348 RepID=UPI001F2C6675|nr:hypothetical protein [Devosia sp. SL43]UJW87941.1 hypothetical protein IM737_20520 [Devosia sp. SL43]